MESDGAHGVTRPANSGSRQRPERDPHSTPLDKAFFPRHPDGMAFEPEAASPLDNLWQEYAGVYRDWDDLTLGRWLSHPLVGAYRLAAKIAHDRQIWLKRLATPPAAYGESPCCRAPLLPLLTRDVRAEGLICEHCNEILAPFEEIPAEVRDLLGAWAQQYEPVHAVAHWDDRQRRRAANYDDAFEGAAKQAEQLLSYAGRELAPKLLETYPAVIWEDQDECLEVRNEDVTL
jgi:hypothetical protein